MASSTSPGTSVVLAPYRVLSRGDNPSERIPIRRLTGRNASAGLDRVYPSTPWRKSDAEEEHPEQAGDHQDLNEVRSRRRCASGRCAAARAGWRRALAHDERREQREATAPSPSVCSEPQP